MTRRRVTASPKLYDTENSEIHAASVGMQGTIYTGEAKRSVDRLG
jgi:hypothetical protein